MTGDRFFRDITDQAWSPDRRIEDMDRLGIDRQVLSPPPVMLCYWAEARAGQAFARMQNEYLADVAARYPARFVAMGTVPLQDPGLAVKELRHARERLGLRAVEIGTCPGGRDLDDPALFDFFAACRDLDVALFVHPATPLIGAERMTRYYFPLIVGNPLETALAISALIFGGVLERLPGLRICFAHGGGAFPFTLARLDHGWAVRPEGPGAIPRHPTSTPGSSTSTRSPSARPICASSWPRSAPTGSPWAAISRSTWATPTRSPRLAQRASILSRDLESKARPRFSSWAPRPGACVGAGCRPRRARPSSSPPGPEAGPGSWRGCRSTVGPRSRLSPAERRDVRPRGGTG